MPIIQTMLGGASGKYWMLTVEGETVGSDTYSIRPTGGLVIDSSDNIFISTDNLGPGSLLPSYENPSIFKFNSKGELQFKKNIGTTSSQIGAIQPNIDGKGGIDIDSSGNIFTTYRSSPSADFQTNDQDCYLVSSDSTGTAQDARLAQIDYQVFNNHVGVRSDDRIWHTISHRETSGPVEVYLSLFEYTSNSLTLIEEKRLNDYNGSGVGSGGFSVDSSDNAIIVGNYEINPTVDDFYIYVQKFSNTTGSSTVSQVFDKHIYSTEPSKITDFHSPNCCTTDSSDNIYIASSLTFGSGTDNRKNAIIKLNSSGTLQWARQFDQDDVRNPQDMVVDSSGNLYGISREFLVKYNSLGVLQWIRKLNFTNAQYDYPDSTFISLDSEENLILTFSVTSTDLIGNYYKMTTRVLKLPNDGTLTGSYGDLVYSEFTSNTESAANVAVANASLTVSNNGPDGGYATITPTSANSTHTTSITLI